METGQQLIVAALHNEVRGLKAKMAIDCTIHFKPAILYRGNIFHKDISLLVTGIGKERMQKGVLQTLEQQKPKMILQVGYAGGCSPIAAAGSLVVANKVMDADTKEVFGCEGELLSKAEKICEEIKLDYHIGKFVTVGNVITAPHEKADLGSVYEAIALDMEASALARIAIQQNIPWLSVKAILDPVEMELPQLQECMEPTGEIKPAALMEHLCKKPDDLMRLPKIQYLASQARQTLEKFIEAWVPLT